MNTDVTISFLAKDHFGTYYRLTETYNLPTKDGKVWDTDIMKAIHKAHPNFNIKIVEPGEDFYTWWKNCSVDIVHTYE